jgi:hypothetical protein
MVAATAESSLGAGWEMAKGAKKNEKKLITVSASAPAGENL